VNTTRLGICGTSILPHFAQPMQSARSRLLISGRQAPKEGREPVGMVEQAVVGTPPHGPSVSVSRHGERIVFGQECYRST
jgi:hypothetical protein